MAKRKNVDPIETDELDEGDGEGNATPGVVVNVIQPKREEQSAGTVTVEKAEPKAELSAEQKAAALAEDRKRAAEIRRLGAKHNVDQKLIDEACDSGMSPQEFGFKAWESKTTPDKQPPAVRLEVGDDNSKDMHIALSAGMRQASNVPISAADRKLFEKHGSKRIVGLHSLARACCEIEGKKLSWGADHRELLSAATSTYTFPEALSDSFNKSLHAGYDMAPRTFLDVFGRKPVKDFKEHKDIKLSSFSRPGNVSGGRELPYATRTESKETFHVDTYGFLFVLTREDFINDDMGIFTDTPRALGFKMGDEFDQLGYEFLTQAAGTGPTMVEDSTVMFATSRATPNYATGSGSALKASALSTALALLNKMKHGEDFLSLQPDFILVPPELWEAAVRLVTSPVFIAGVNLTSTELEGNKNVYQGIARPFMSARLSGATNGTTAWYLGANQRIHPSIAAVTLNGVETPVVETVDVPSNLLGLGWRCYFDMGWAALDWRTIIRNKGA